MHNIKYILHMSLDAKRDIVTTPYTSGLKLAALQFVAKLQVQAMRHCKAGSYKHDSHRQSHDGTCSFAKQLEGRQFETPVLHTKISSS